MPVTIYSNVRDNHWSGQKPSMEKNTVGNEPYIKKLPCQVAFLCYEKETATSQKPNKNNRLNSRDSYRDLPQFLKEDKIFSCYRQIQSYGQAQ